MALARSPNFIILVATLVIMLVGLSEVNRLVQQLPARQQFSSLSKQIQRTSYLIKSFKELERSHFELQKSLQKIQSESELTVERLEDLETSTVSGQQEQFDILTRLQERVNRLEAAIQGLKRQLSMSVEFLPLKDTDLIKDRDDHVYHYFMSMFKGRGMVQGPPQLLTFPSSSLSQDRLLCFKGNSTSNGAQNFYAFAFRESLPIGSSLVPGITLISDTYWDFFNPWHAMYNLLQFVYWRLDNKCAIASNLLLFHQGEYRMEIGTWIRSVMNATGLPSSVTLSGASRGEESLCFERAVVSRSGIGGTKRHIQNRMFTETRCQARRSCNIQVGDYDTNTTGRDGGDGNRRHVNITLMLRSGGRRFLDEGAWQQVVKEQCQAAHNCTWSVMHVAQLTFCQQVEVMSHTNILLAAHGAQLTNMIFMSPGGRVMEMFPAGWLELAGHGQFIYRNLANWLGLHHEGYWRDPSTPPCRQPSDVGGCFSHYKNQPIGINATHISMWLGQIIANFQSSPLFPPKLPQEKDIEMLPHLGTCECPN